MHEAGVYYNGVAITEYNQLIERQQIWIGELDYIANQYDEIYIDELNIEVKITDIIKTTNGIVYHTNYTIDLIEDYVTAESKTEAEKKYDILVKREIDRDNKNKNIGTKFFENFFNFLFNKKIL